MTSDRHKKFGQKNLERRLGKLTVGDFLHTWRVSEEMSLANFGKLVGMSVANLCDIEKGRKRVSLSQAEMGPILQAANAGAGLSALAYCQAQAPW